MAACFRPRIAYLLPGPIAFANLQWHCSATPGAFNPHSDRGAAV